jgi:hypothetical protein
MFPEIPAEFPSGSVRTRRFLNLIVPAVPEFKAPKPPKELKQ